MDNSTDTLQEQLNVLQNNADVMFLVLNSFIIYFMQCGFAFLECGAVRSKNTTNILMKNVLDSFISGLAYWTIGYALAFGEGSFFLGYTKWASYGVSSIEYATWFFHFVFAATAATIVSGALAERCEFIAYLVYSIVLTGFMYPVVTHWAWSSEGWLANGPEVLGEPLVYQDFAGSGVVHLLGGVAAFVGAALMGPRMHRFTKDGEVLEIRGHSVPLAALGGFILFFGFFAFNGGSQASISQPGDGEAVAKAVTNTILSGSGAAFSSLATMRIVGVCQGQPSWSLLASINGALTGMVAICAGANAVHPWGAVVIGFFAGLAYLAWAALVRRMRVDDPLDAVAVHGGGGLWGLIAAPLLSQETGIVYAWSQRSAYNLGWNLAGALAISAWTAVICLIMFGSLKCFKLLRVSKEVEMRGLDIFKHNEPAYPVESYGHGWEDHEGYVEGINRLRTGSLNGVLVGKQYENSELERVDKSMNLSTVSKSVEEGPHGTMVVVGF